MLLTLHSTLSSLLSQALPRLFGPGGSATAQFTMATWRFDPLSRDPVAGEAGPEATTERLPFSSASPHGPHQLSRPPYPGPRRLYLLTPTEERVALTHDEVLWAQNPPGQFTLRPRLDRMLEPYTQVEVQYDVLAAGTHLKTLHRLTLQISAEDPATADQALVMALAVLSLNRASLMQHRLSWNSGLYQAVGALKTMYFSRGATTSANVHTLVLHAEVDLHVGQALDDTQGIPIRQIHSLGHTTSLRPLAIEPAIQA